MPHRLESSGFMLSMTGSLVKGTSPKSNVLTFDALLETTFCFLCVHGHLIHEEDHMRKSNQID